MMSNHTKDGGFQTIIPDYAQRTRQVKGKVPRSPALNSEVVPIKPRPEAETTVAVYDPKVVAKIKRNAVREERRKEKNKEECMPDKFPHLAETFSDWDLMVAAKYCPGSVNAPYVGSMTTFPCPTGVLKNCITLNETFNINTSLPAPYGTCTYTLIAWYPLATLYYGQGGAGNYPTGTKLGGLYTAQTNTNPVILNLSNFGATAYASSMIQTYGSDASSIASRAFVWASEIEFQIVAPAANIVGTFYEGTINAGQLRSANIGVSQLIAIAKKVSGGKSSFSLRGSVVNHQIAFWQQSANWNDGDGDLESIHFVLMQTPVMSLTTGLPTTFSLIANISSNYLMWPRPNDTFAHSLGVSLTQSAAVAAPEPIPPPQTHAVDPMKKPTSGFKDWISGLFSWDTLKSVGKIGAGIATAIGTRSPLAGIAAYNTVGNMLGDGNNVGPLAANNPFERNTDAALALKSANQENSPHYYTELAEARRGTKSWGASNMVMPSGLRAGVNSPPALYRGGDIRYEIEKHLNIWNDWPGPLRDTSTWAYLRASLEDLLTRYNDQEWYTDSEMKLLTTSSSAMDEEELEAKRGEECADALGEI